MAGHLLRPGSVFAFLAVHRRELAELKRKVAQLQRALDHKTYELEVAGELLRD
ncbi:MAG: hypothetical protein ACJ74U_04710 [Jatrophihabitantaceae bacterium]